MSVSEVLCPSGMVSHIYLVTVAAVACTVISWSFGSIGGDLVLCIIAALAYWILSQSRQRFKANLAKAKIASKVDCSTEDAETVFHDGFAEERHAKQMPAKQLEDNKISTENETSEGETHDEEIFDSSEHVTTMQKHASARSISGAMRTFRFIQQNGGSANSLMYNIILQTWINCGNVQAAEDWMEEILEAGMADETSFSILIKALVRARAPDKAKAIADNMHEAGVQPNIAIFDELLHGFAQESRFDDGLSLLEEMYTQAMQPTDVTLSAIVTLVDGSRSLGRAFERIDKILDNYGMESNTQGDCSHLLASHRKPRPKEAHADRGIEPSLVSHAVLPCPRLAAVMLQAKEATSRLCAHEVHICGELPQIKAVRRSLKQYGFMDKDDASAWPLNGHWATEHGLTVVIEGKIVRWSRLRASRLRFTRKDRKACMLSVYGEPANGQLVSAPAMLGMATKELRWDNGDVWHSNEGLVIGQNALLNQSMTKTSRDVIQDEACRSRGHMVLKSVSKNRLGLTCMLEDTIVSYLGRELFYVRVHFESKWNPSCLEMEAAEADIFDLISRRHPRVGFRHCWAEQSIGSCGQRTLVNGEEVDEDVFNRHIKAVWR